MTENEAVEAMQFDLKIGGEIHSQVLRDAVDVAIQALEEVQQYRAIGTPEELQDMKSNYFEALSDWRQYRKIGTFEECRTAREKQIPKKPTYEGDGYAPDGTLVYDTWICPCCDKRYEVDYDDYDYCPNCGQKLDLDRSDEE
jgi:rubrerythrin